MKYYPRLNVYKASNVIFYPENITAYSYAWWRFVTVIKGKVIFNNYRYSVSTAGHQRKVKQLLDKLGIKVDLFIQSQLSLTDNPQRIAAGIQVDIDTLRIERNKPRKRQATKDDLGCRIAYLIGVRNQWEQLNKTESL